MLDRRVQLGSVHGHRRCSPGSERCREHTLGDTRGELWLTTSWSCLNGAGPTGRECRGYCELGAVELQILADCVITMHEDVLLRIRQELRGDLVAQFRRESIRGELRAEIRAGDEETRREHRGSCTERFSRGSRPFRTASSSAAEAVTRRTAHLALVLSGWVRCSVSPSCTRAEHQLHQFLGHARLESFGVALVHAHHVRDDSALAAAGINEHFGRAGAR